jgi:hypothetical protein
MIRVKKKDKSRTKLRGTIIRAVREMHVDVRGMASRFLAAWGKLELAVPKHPKAYAIVLGGSTIIAFKALDMLVHLVHFAAEAIVDWGVYLVIFAVIVMFLDEIGFSRLFAKIKKNVTKEELEGEEEVV